MADASEPVTLGQLLDLGLLPGYRLLGGAAGLTAPLRAVVPGTDAKRVGELAAGTLVVFEQERLEGTDPLTDVAIRLGSRAGVAGIVLQRPRHAVPMATRLLADKLALPVVLLDHVDTSAVVAELDAHVRRPEAAGARLLVDVSRRLREAAPDSEALLRVLGTVLRCPVALVDGEGRPFGAGRAAGDTRLTELMRPKRGGRVVPFAAELDAELVLGQPLGMGEPGPANMWLVATLPLGSPLVESAGHALGIAAWAFTAYLATESLAAERLSRERTLLLTEILDEAESPPRRSVERATAAGWRLTGWHTAVHVAASGQVRVTDLRRRLTETLARHDLDVQLVERPEGWVFWLSSDAAPEVRRTTDVADRIRHALLREERETEGLRLCAGIGRSHEGTAGLKQSLREAHQACVLAATSDAHGAVTHVDGSSNQRTLSAWYASAPAREAATEHLDPLLAADPSGDLLRTLACYLDHESSATTTAIVLGVHRNTVLHRLSRITDLLETNLENPDDRLATHLATRILRGRQEP